MLIINLDSNCLRLLIVLLISHIWVVPVDAYRYVLTNLHVYDFYPNLHVYYVYPNLHVYYFYIICILIILYLYMLGPRGTKKLTLFFTGEFFC